MKKGYLVLKFLIMVMAVMLVSGQGCERGEKVGEGVFLGGNDGLIIEFLEDAPPLGGNYKGEPILLDVELINRGEVDVAERAAHVYLTGALASSEVVDATLGPSFETVNKDFIAGIEEGEGGLVESAVIVELGKATYNGEILGDSIPLEARASVCYPYETKVQVNDFCVPSTARIVEDEECEIVSTENLINDKDNSGAPVHVTSLREQKGPDFVRVTLDINNVGSGEVVNACAREILRQNLNQLIVTMPQNYDCTFKDASDINRGTVELRGGHAVLRCKREVTNSGRAYKEPLTMTLNYFYMQETSKTISINSGA